MRNQTIAACAIIMALGAAAPAHAQTSSPPAHSSSRQTHAAAPHSQASPGMNRPSPSALGHAPRLHPTSSTAISANRVTSPNPFIPNSMPYLTQPNTPPTRHPGITGGTPDVPPAINPTGTRQQPADSPSWLSPTMPSVTSPTYPSIDTMSPTRGALPPLH